MKTRVAVVYGGRSGEHEISLLSAESVIAAMNPDRYEITRYLIDKEGHWSPRAIMPEPGAIGTQSGGAGPPTLTAQNSQ